MAHPNDIIARVVNDRLLCTACATDAPEGSEVNRWDVETDDVCAACGHVLHAESRRYVIGSNMPGYMPDSEPFTMVGTFDEARAVLLGDLEEADNHVSFCSHGETDDAACDDDDCSECADARAVADALEDVPHWNGPDSVTVGNYVYWIVEGTD